jgi:hypothetical protein
MSVYYSGTVRKGAKVIRLPVRPVPREHVSVARARQGLQEHAGRIIDASERFSRKLNDSR